MTDRLATTNKNREQLRILFAVDSQFPSLGGAQIQAMKIARALREEGILVEFLAPEMSDQEELQEIIDGFPTRRIPYPRIRYIGGIILILRFAKFFVRYHNRYNVIHIHITNLLAVATGLIQSIIRTPVVTKISGYYEFEEGILRKAKWHKPMLKLLQIAILKNKYYQCISSEVRNRMLDLGVDNKRILAIPNGVVIRPAIEQEEKADFVFGYCGRLREVKGLDLLLAAFAQVKNELPLKKMNVLLAGDGKHEKRLRELASSLNIEEHVKFLGKIENTDGFYRKIDIYIQPSYSEGLSNAVLEAMSYSLPVIVSDISGNRDLVTDQISGFTFPAGNSNDLATIMIDCINNKERCQQVGVNALNFVRKNHSVEKVRDELIEFYDKVGHTCK